MNRLRLCLTIPVLVCIGCGSALPSGLSSKAPDASSALFGLRLGVERPVSDAIAEPSDLSFDPSTGTFWTVSDQRGSIHRVSPDGAAAGTPLNISGNDLEAVTLDPKTGHLFAVDESSWTMFETTRDGSVVRRVTLGIKGDNTGIEGIAYDPKTDGFIAVKERNPTELVFFDRQGAITSTVAVKTQDLSAVTVSPDGLSIYVVGRFEEAVLELDRAGHQKARFALNVPAIEGIAFDDRGRLFAVADLGAKSRGMLYMFVREGAH